MHVELLKILFVFYFLTKNMCLRR